MSGVTATTKATVPVAALSTSQRQVVDRPGRQVLLGGPGTGKTTALVAWALHRAPAGPGGGPGPVVLVPSRRAADRVRDALEQGATGVSGDRVARTPHSLAWAVVREHALRAGRRPPRLVPASERDEALAELLAGHLEDGTAPAWPPHLEPSLRATRAFRDELREMSARLVEHGVSPDGLARLGRRHGRAEWEAAARVLAEADEVEGLRGDEAHDPASIVAVAADLVADRSTGLAEWLAGQLGHLGVDDAQDLTPAAWSFVREVADVVGDLLVVGDPDGGTQTFRGAHPGLLEQAADFLGDPAAPVRSTTVQQPLGRSRLLRRVCAAVGRELHGARVPAWSPAAVAAADPADGAPADGVAADDGGVALLVCLDRADEAAVVAGELRRRRHRETDPLPWSQMAVVVRSVSGADELRRALDSAGVPVRVPGVRAPLREEAVVGLLLLALDVAADPDRLDPAALERLFVGPLGGGDPVRWRRLVLQARAVARARSVPGDDVAVPGGEESPDVAGEVVTAAAEGRAVSGDEALAGVCAEVRQVLRGRAPVPAHGQGFAGLAPAVAGPLVRLVEVLAGGAAAVPDGLEEALWQVWDRLRVAERWRRTALRGGPDAVRADADLDAVLALFDAAAGWVDRNPRGTVAGFVEHLRSRAVGDDRLGGDGPADAVTVTTPAGAVGERWDVVVVAGVQDGVWPNPRLRGSLLGLTDLVGVVRGSAVPLPRGSGATSRHAELRRQARRDVVLDELRLFHVAVSRARRELLVTAADDATSTPSDLCTLVADAVGPALVTTPGGPRAPRAAVAAELGAGSSLVEVTAALRRTLARTDDETHRRAAAGLLARLAEAGVRGADPAEWSWRVGEGPGRPRRVEEVHVSPSSVERFLRCPLQWYLTTSGGTTPRETAQGLGTLVHAALEQVPDADVVRLREVVERGWGDLELGDGWVSTHQRTRVEAMLRKLSVWVAGQRAAGVDAVAAEVPFSYRVDDVTVRGTVDRVEVTADGGVRVVDLKTGKQVVSGPDTLDNPQLQLYQLAVELGALPGVAGPPAGGLLLYVGSSHASACERSQPAPDAEALEAVRQRVREVGAGMRASTFAARPSNACARCPVRSSCPTTAEGRRTPPPVGEGPVDGSPADGGPS